MAKADVPPVPPAGRSDKGPGEPPHRGGEPAAEHGRKAPPANLAEQDRHGNIRQNTTNKGLQQDR